MKLRVEPWRIIWRFLITILVIYALAAGGILLTFIKIDSTTNEIIWLPFSTYHYIIISLLLAIGIGTFIPSLFSYYYVVEDKYFLMKKYGKTFEFTYKNIEFIDIDESKRKKMVIFYAPTCGTKYLLGDKKGVLLDTLIKKCHDIMSVEEFRRAHPEQRY